MFGLLDCTHTYWKNCIKGWVGSYSGKEHKPSIVLEAIFNHHTFFGMQVMVTLVENLMNGVFDFREELLGVVPYKIGDEEFVKSLSLLMQFIHHIQDL
ncbi:hypothetical protein ACHAW6_000090 [Cyclotella cf. meneghiniana]